MVAVTFPDGARREFPQNITGFDIAKEISPSLLKRSVAMVVDGALADLSDPIDHDAKVEFINREEDLGSPGLRNAKRSYNPVKLVPAYELIFK